MHVRIICACLPVVLVGTVALLSLSQAPATGYAQTATGFPLPQLVVAAYVETVILPAYTGKIFTAAERLTKECPQMFSRATMQQITCEQFIQFVKQEQFKASFFFGGRAEYTFVTTDYTPDRNSAIVVVQITRRNSRGQVERQWAQSFLTVLEDGAWRMHLDDQMMTAFKKAFPTKSPSPASVAQSRTVALSVKTSAGPITLIATSVEFSQEQTTVLTTVENTADAEANLFNAIAAAKLADDAGKSYAVRAIRSDLPDRVPPRGSVRGRLVFEPLSLPPAVKSVTLTLPGIRVGDAIYDITLDIRF